MSLKKDSGSSKFPQVVVVEASAGSGKTLALAKRYLELLINPKFSSDPIALSSILAITFTNKATIEMKERILELLKKIALNSFSSPEEKKDILDLLELDEEKAAVAAHAIVEKIIRHYNFFGVQTIDSFINALLLGCALNIDRSSSFEIKRDYQAHLNFCLDLVIEAAPKDTETLKLLEEFLDHYLFVENRKGWFPKEDILGLMHSLFTLSNKHGKLFQVYQGKGKDVIKLKRHIYSQISKLATSLPEGLKANAAKSIESFLNKSKDIFDIAQLPLSFKNPKPPMNKSKLAAEQFTKSWKKIHQQLVELSELDATVAYNPYVGLFHKLLGFFQIISKKEDVLFLEELNRKVRLLFDQEGLTVAEAYYRLAMRFRHYLIDEFQDTSSLQWQNLEMMVEEALSSGGSLFYVGDKKQAIYRFRGGEAGLFDKVAVEFSRYNLIPTHLTDNWRSQKAIIDFNNQVFAKDNLLKALELSGINEILDSDSETIDEIVDVFKDARQKGRDKNSQGYVVVERLDEKNQTERNQIMQPKIISLVKQLLKRFGYEDIAILTRNNSEVELVSSWLLSESIPVESEKTLNVIENPLIKEIICFLRFLHSPIDNLSFAGFILGEIFTKASRISKLEIRDFIFQANSQAGSGNRSYLYQEFRRQYPEIWKQYFEQFFKTIGFISVYELMASIYSCFDLFNQFAAFEIFFMKFLELIKQSEDESAGVEEFLEYLQNASPEDLYVTITHSDSVKVLTVHKSKGLEFPVVIIPFLRMDISPETGAKGTNSYCLEDGSDLGLVRITKNHRVFSKKLAKIYAQSYKKACIDELNNVYVALTRPQYELYIFIPKKSSSSVNKAAFLIPQDLTRQGEPIKYLRPKKLTKEPEIKPLAKKYKYWIDTLKEEYVNKPEVINRHKVLAGNITHALLAQIGNCFGKDRKEVVSQALELVKKAYPLVSDFTDYEQKINKLLAEPGLKDIFYLNQGQVFCEREVVNKYGDLKRIDRLIVTNTQVTVVDYKSSKARLKEDREQIKQYLQILSSIYPKVKLRGFLLYLDDFYLEEVKQ